MACELGYEGVGGTMLSPLPTVRRGGISKHRSYEK